MGKITALIHVTADGFISDPDGGLKWHLPFWDEQLCECLIHETADADTLLLGRNTYEGLKAQNTAIINDPCASRTDLLLAETLQRIPKVAVTSQRLYDPWYNTEFRTAEHLLFMPQMQTDSSAGIVIIGSMQLVKWLACKGMIRHYTVWRHPLRIGSGNRISESADYLEDFEISGQDQLRSGVTQIKYQHIRS